MDILYSLGMDILYSLLIDILYSLGIDILYYTLFSDLDDLLVVLLIDYFKSLISEVSF